MLIENNDSSLAQLAITSLNGISGNKTFGIRPGASNRKPATKIVSKPEM